MDAVALMGRMVKETAQRTADRDGIGAAKLVVFANAVEDNPFMAGAFHGMGEGECVVSVGVSGPGVVSAAISDMKGEPFDKIAETIKKTAFNITRMGELVAREASRRLGVEFGIVDLSLAPTPAQGDSVAHILEAMGLERTGTHGTTAALALLNDAVKKGGIMASSHVGGLSGAFIPVSEDVYKRQPAAIPGLFVGCALANLGSPFGIIDIDVYKRQAMAAATVAILLFAPVNALIEYIPRQQVDTIYAQQEPYISFEKKALAAIPEEKADILLLMDPGDAEFKKTYWIMHYRLRPHHVTHQLGNFDVRDVAAVSYTHLDVYKRQGD